MTDEHNKAIEEILYERKVKRTGSLVFCINCGAYGVTLRKWHNSYICEDCMRERNRIGEETFTQKVLAKYREVDSDNVESIQETETSV